jgi:hypothetical protein
MNQIEGNDGGVRDLRCAPPFSFEDQHVHDDELLAHHEAGHAVAALALGIGVVCVSINGTRDHAACTRINPADAATCDANAGSIARHTMMKIAGPAAEAMYTGCAPDGGEWSTDITTAGMLCAGMSSQELQALVDAAFDMVDAYWDDIVRVADALMTKRALSGSDVRDVIGKLMRSSPASECRFWE